MTSDVVGDIDQRESGADENAASVSEMGMRCFWVIQDAERPNLIGVLLPPCIRRYHVLVLVLFSV